MKTHKLNDLTIGFLPISDWATDFEIITIDNIHYLLCSDLHLFRREKIKLLPQGNWQLLGLSNDLTEEQAKEIIPSELSVLEIELYLNYQELTYRKYYTFGTALESYNSLKQMLGLDPAERYVTLIKKD